MLRSAVPTTHTGEYIMPQKYFEMEYLRVYSQNMENIRTGGTVEKTDGRAAVYLSQETLCGIKTA